MTHIQDAQDACTPRRSRLGRGARAAGGVAFAAALTLGGAGLATADPGPGSDLEATTLSASSQEDAVEYWTAERMESATPADELIQESEAPSGQVESAGAFKVPATPAVGADAPAQASPQAAPGDVETPADTDHVGKVFFTVNGSDYVCSGNAVASANESTVSTAGHCVNEAGTWASNWVFAPGYDNGETPYGLWSASDLYSTDQWVSSEDMNYDIAFAIVEPDGGASTLTDAVGGSGIAFNAARGELYSSYGYPAAAPFDGETLENCQGNGFEDILGGTDDQAIDCDMTGGSSGGPWFIGGSADGYQVSVNSFGYNTQPNVMYGPYLGDVAQQVYQEAAAA